MTTTIDNIKKPTWQRRPSNATIVAANLYKIEALHRAVPTIPLDVIKRTAIKNAGCLKITPAAFARNVTKTCKLLNISVERFISILRVYPGLAYIDPSAHEQKVRAIVALLRCTQNDAISIIQRAPTLLSRQPQSLSAALSSLIDILQIEPHLVATVLKRNPQLFSLTTEHLQKTISCCASFFDVEPEVFIAAARTQPQIFSLSPDNIFIKSQRYMGIFQMSRAEFATVILQSPSLVTIKPDAVASKLNALKRLMYYANEKKTLKELILTEPAILTYARSRILSRCLVARAKLCRRKCLSYVRLNNAQTTKMLKDHLTGKYGDAAAPIIMRYVAMGLIVDEPIKPSQLDII